MHHGLEPHGSKWGFASRGVLIRLGWIQAATKLLAKVPPGTRVTTWQFSVRSLLSEDEQNVGGHLGRVT